MNIVIAETVLLGREIFEPLGNVTVIPDAQISNADLRHADALIIRSKTKVSDALLADTPVQFIGTATAGFDHITLSGDQCWTAAPGCNADSVTEYMVAALLELNQQKGVQLVGKKIAIIGVGQVGHRVVKAVTALGMTPLLNDPPRALETPDLFQSLDDILPQADFVTFHTPLTSDGPFPTAQLADGHFFEKLKPGAIFMNAARGGAVENQSLLSALERGIVRHAILDVFDPEPEVPLALKDAAFIATPHIGGYSYEGALNGTRICFERCCAHFQIPISSEPYSISNDQYPKTIELDAAGLSDATLLHQLVCATYRIMDDDTQFRALLVSDDPATRRANFTHMRKTYHRRREFPNYRVCVVNASAPLKEKIRTLGFQLI